jgi:hypothetical protein
MPDLQTDVVIRGAQLARFAGATHSPFARGRAPTYNGSIPKDA